MSNSQTLSSYSRIMVAGCCGAGKSSLSRQLTQSTNLPLIHLDQQYWQAGWVEPSTKEWRQKMKLLIAGKQWIMDGNYSGTWDLRLPRAELIIYLRYPLSILLYRAIKRIVINYGKVRPDMAPGCPERFSFSFVFFIIKCYFHHSKKHLNMLANLEDHQTLLVFYSPRALERWLQEQIAGRNAQS